MEQAVREALRQSPQARAARASLESARVQADRDKPVARPTVTAIVSGTAQGPRVEFPRPNGQLATVLPEGVGRLDLILEQPLYRAGGRAARERYLAQLSSGELEYRKAISDIALKVRRAYIDLLRSEAGVRTARDGVDSAIRYQRLVERQVAAGTARPVDSQTVQSQVAEAQSALAQADGGLALARSNVNRLLGRALQSPVAGVEPMAAPAVPGNADEAIARSLRARPELLLLDRNLQSARAGIVLARAQSLPTVNARGQVTEQTPSAFQHEHYYAATVELRWTIADAGRARQDTREARAQTDRVQALVEDAREGIGLETLQTWERMRSAQSRIELARTQRSGLEATEIVAEKSYEVGRSTVYDVQTAQREVRGARMAELSAVYDLHGAYADFLYAQGDILSGIVLSGALESSP